MNRHPVWRLLPLEEPTDPLWNMAVDEALLDGPSDRSPALRFYQWSPEALSIGYFQSVSSVVQRYRCPERGLCVVRRVTGGGLVHHGKDLTLSLVLCEGSEFFSCSVGDFYKGIHVILMEALRGDYPALQFADSRKPLQSRSSAECFKEPTHLDLVSAGKKIVGSSQRRRKSVVLHQTAVFPKGGADATAFRIREAFEEKLGVRFKEKKLTGEEIERAKHLIQKKYLRNDFSFSVNRTEG